MKTYVSVNVNIKVTLLPAGKSFTCVLSSLLTNDLMTNDPLTI